MQESTTSSVRSSKPSSRHEVHGFLTSMLHNMQSGQSSGPSTRPSTPPFPVSDSFGPDIGPYSDPPPPTVDIDPEVFAAAWDINSEESLPPQFVDSLEAYLNPQNDSSDEEATERSDDKSVADLEAQFPTLFTHQRQHIDQDANSPFFPWPDRETCVLDILCHVPQCAFSRKQNTAIHWAMLALGLENLPSDRTMDDIDKEMQRMCGIQSIQYEGKLGHVYYGNDFPAIIAQKTLESILLRKIGQTGGLKEMDPDLLTPAHCIAGEDFFTLKPALLNDRLVCMPSCWFVRDKKVFAKAWPMTVVDIEDHGHGWAVQTFSEIEISDSDLLLSFKQLQNSFSSLELIDPHIILVKEKSADDFVAWEKMQPMEGNCWRSKSQGKHEMSQRNGISTNLSYLLQLDYPDTWQTRNQTFIFFSTSNIAPPLEMMDGFVEQLLQAQETGVWAWDAKLQDIVLLIPSVLALCSDNPMQSEFACHIGFWGWFFCCNCWVSGSNNDGETKANGNDGNDSDTSITSNSGKKKRTVESMKDILYSK
ncbi:hypothetical protein BDP27DRAFT_1427641 [Rhodocollybia butyracea]|uniref:Uncharacterized protein n=1 Tax=Rhodocollybia butyracea TaxID=206335 RepID=A0A9P5PCM0_9AGAR|nr:hypothetical protein BDP27DRAFT_1427641 [Rhodocollybia butyracea]